MCVLLLSEVSLYLIKIFYTIVVTGLIITGDLLCVRYVRRQGIVLQRIFVLK